MRFLILFLINFVVLYNTTFVLSDDDVQEYHIITHEAINKQYPFVGFFSKKTNVAYEEFETEVYCGGSIIHRNWVLTAGHCCAEPDFNQIIQFTAGTVVHSRNITTQVRTVLKFIHHEKINDEQIGKTGHANMYDIAVAKLNSSLYFDEYVNFIMLNQNKDSMFVDESVTYMGWGSNWNNMILPVLRYQNATGICLDKCRKRLEGEIILDATYHVCAIPWKAYQSMCDVDFGGPVILGELQIGVVTDVYCGNHTSVYTNVAGFFDWIRAKLGMCNDEIYDTYGSNAPRDYKSNKPPANQVECLRYGRDDCSKIHAKVEWLPYYNE